MAHPEHQQSQDATPAQHTTPSPASAHPDSASHPTHSSQAPQPTGTQQQDPNNAPSRSGAHGGASLTDAQYQTAFTELQTYAQEALSVAGSVGFPVDADTTLGDILKATSHHDFHQSNSDKDAPAVAKNVHTA